MLRLSRAWGLALGFSALFCVALLFSPVIWTLLWHLRHGDRILFEQQSLRVPLRWIVTEVQTEGSVEKRIELTKLPLFVFRTHPQGSISFRPSDFDGREKPEAKSKSWQSFYWNYLSSGEPVSGPIQVDVGSQHATCMETLSRAPSDNSSCSCLFLESGWTITFWGTRNDLETFFTVVRSIRPATKS